MQHLGKVGAACSHPESHTLLGPGASTIGPPDMAGLAVLEPITGESLSLEITAQG